jgi:hypothetical protein
MEETPEGFVGALEYNTDLFDMATIERLSTELVRLLDAVMENPDQPVGLGAEG